MLHHIIGPVNILSDPIDRYRLDHGNAAAHYSRRARSVLVSAINRVGVLIGPEDASALVMKVKCRHLSHEACLSQNSYARAIQIGDEQRLTVCHVHFGALSVRGHFAQLTAHSRVAIHACTIVASICVGAPLLLISRCMYI